MSYSIAYEAKAGYIAIVYTGTIDQSVVIKVASEATRLVQQHNCFLVLIDAHEATTTLSITDIYDLPEIFSEILAQAGIQIERVKQAIVAPDTMNDFTFFATVSRARGQNIMLFRDLDAARRWLWGE